MTERVHEPMKADAPGPTRASSAGRVSIVRRAPHGGHEFLKVAGRRDVSGELEAVRGSGAPLPQPRRTELEGQLGEDLRPIRLHRGSRADALAEALGATALTSGDDVFLHRTAPHPSTSAGRRLLGHEVAHVLQQRHGPVEGAPAPGGLRVSHPSDRHERAAAGAADLLECGGRPDAIPVAAAAGSGVVVQRQTGLELVPAATPFLVPPAAVVLPPAPVPIDGAVVGWATDAMGTAQSGASQFAGQGVRTLAQGAARLGGTALVEGGEAALVTVSGTGAAAAPGAAVVAGPPLAEGLLTVGSAALPETVGLVAGPAATVIGTTAAATTGEVLTGTALGGAVATTGEAALVTTAIITPVGWVVIGVVVLVVVGGVAIYLLTREYEPEPEIVAAPRVAGATRGTGKGSMAPLKAPGATRPARVEEPFVGPPAITPGAPGSSPVSEPEHRAPAVAPGAGPATPLQAAGPLEGRTNVIVDDRLTGKRITDIDHIEDDILWEEKSAVSAPVIADWIKEHVTEKFEAYVEARKHPPLYPYYKDAAIGFEFEYRTSVEFGEAVWNEMDRLRAEYPDVVLLDPVFRGR